MGFIDLMKKRESCRAYSEKTVDRELLQQIVEAGRLSPSACNSQPWKFIVVDDPEAREKVCDALVVENGDTGAPWRGSVPAFIIFVEQPAKVMPDIMRHYNDSQRFAQNDLGMAAMNMSYMAMELGLATCLIGMSDQKKMEEYFGIPAGLEVRITMAVGYPAEESEPRKKVRKATEEICSFNQW